MGGVDVSPSFAARGNQGLIVVGCGKLHQRGWQDIYSRCRTELCGWPGEVAIAHASESEWKWHGLQFCSVQDGLGGLVGLPSLKGGLPKSLQLEVFSK